MKKKILICSFVVFALIISCAFYFQAPVIFQRGNPIPYLLAVSKLSDKTPYAQVHEEETKTVYISKKGICNPLFQDIEKSSGLSYQEQAGSGFIFSGAANHLTVTNEIYLGLYSVWEVSKQF